MPKKHLFVISIVVIFTLIITGCSKQDNRSGDNSIRQLQLVEYPERVTQNEPFNIRGKYLTQKPNSGEVKILLSVLEKDSSNSLYTDKKSISDKSQDFIFSDINIVDIDKNIYFQLNLIKDGKYITNVSNQTDLSRVSNWHTNIITTYFLPEGKSTWGYPLKDENPYYFALPYRDFYYYVWDSEKEKKVLERKNYYGITDVKNRWIEIFHPKTGKTAYAQWEDVGPWNIYDPDYVFGNNDERPYAEMGIDMGWLGYYRETNGAGLDVSPTVMKYLNNNSLKEGMINVNWRFVKSSEVPDGPWKDKISGAEAKNKVLNLKTQTLRNQDK